MVRAWRLSTKAALTEPSGVTSLKWITGAPQQTLHIPIQTSHWTMTAKWTGRLPVADRLFVSHVTLLRLGRARDDSCAVWGASRRRIPRRLSCLWPGTNPTLGALSLAVQHRQQAGSGHYPVPATGEAGRPAGRLSPRRPAGRLSPRRPAGRLSPPPRRPACRRTSA